MRTLTPILILFLMSSFCRGSNQDLQRRVQHLEGQLANLESLVLNIMKKELAGPYQLKRRCPIPEVEHGRVKCNKAGIKDPKYRHPGTYCTATCMPGYISTPGVTCSLDGYSWSGKLRCEKYKELLVVSGGTETDLSVEVINFHENSTGCDLKIPDLETNAYNEVRLMHNMFFSPADNRGRPRLQIWVCNGLSQSDRAECDYWEPGNPNWKHHSFPNRKFDIWGRGALEASKSMGGRYGAGSFTWDGLNFIVGGMVSKGNQHQHSKAIRYYDGDQDYWSDSPLHRMNTKRTLFCIAQLNQTTPSFVAIGGHSGIIEKSVEVLKGDRKISDMTTARNGHSCVGTGGDEEKILVSGGSDRHHRSGAKALKTSEIYNGDTDQWEMVGEMNQGRFGHALVNIGGRIIALGGKEWNPDRPLKNAEEFDLTTNTWYSIGDVMKIPRANFGFVKIPHSLIPGCTIH